MGFKKKASGGGESVYMLQVSGGSRGCVIEIAGSHTLAQLHQAIHDAIGPRELGAWEFLSGGRSFGDNRNRTYGPDDAGETTVDDLKIKAGQFFGYLSGATRYLIEIQGLHKSSRGFDDPRVVGVSGGVSEPAPGPAPAKPKAAPAATTGGDAEVVSYLLSALVQRLEKTHPGLSQELLDAARADLSAAGFDEAMKILKRNVDSHDE